MLNFMDFPTYHEGNCSPGLSQNLMKSRRTCHLSSVALPRLQIIEQDVRTVMHRGAHPNLVKSCPVVERTSSPPHLFDMPASPRCLDLSRASENGVGGGRDPGTWLCLPLHVLSFHPSIIFPLFFFRILSPWCLLAACLSPTLTVILLYVYSLATLVYFLLRPLICLIFPPILHSTARRFSTLFVRSFSPLISLPS